MCLCDGPGPDVYDAVIRKAAKPHRCCECGETIETGQHYESVSGLWDGQWSNYKTCPKCAQLQHLLSTETDCCIGHGGLQSEVSVYDYPGLIRRHVTAIPGEGRTFSLGRANACSLSYADLYPKLYGRTASMTPT